MCGFEVRVVVSEEKEIHITRVFSLIINDWAILSIPIAFVVLILG